MDKIIGTVNRLQDAMDEQKTLLSELIELLEEDLERQKKVFKEMNDA